MNRLLFLLTSTLFVVLVGCKTKNPHLIISPPLPQEASLNIRTEPQTLDPRKARSLHDLNVIKMVMEGLTRIDPKGETSLAIAETVALSNDKKTYTFTLRKAYWSNGDLITSYHFRDAWKESLSPNVYAPNAHLLYIIQNGREAKRGKLPLSLIGIETPTPRILIVTLEHPAPYFLQLTSHPIYFPINPHCSSHTNWAAEHHSYIGNGPFFIKEWQHYKKMQLSANPTYWDHDAVSLKAIHLFMREDPMLDLFENKQVQWDGSPFATIATAAIETLKKEKKLQTTPSLATAWIRLNVEKSPLHIKKLRHALAYALDRKSIVQHVTQGSQLPATSIVPISMGLQQTPYFQDGDREGAQLLIDQIYSLKEVFANVTLLYPSDERNHLIAQTLQSQWKEALNLLIKLEPVTPATFFDRLSKKEYTLSLGSWFADFNDPINFLEVFKSKDIGTNNTNWENSRYAELLDEARLCTSEEKRKELLKQSEAILIEEMPVIPLFHFTTLFLKDPRLKNAYLNHLGTIDFKWAYIEE